MVFPSTLLVHNLTYIVPRIMHVFSFLRCKNFFRIFNESASGRLERSCNLSRSQPPICHRGIYLHRVRNFIKRELYKNNRRGERAPYAKRHVAEGQRVNNVTETSSSLEECWKRVLHVRAAPACLEVRLRLRALRIFLRKRDYPSSVLSFSSWWWLAKV